MSVRPNLPRLTALRWYAALLVFFFHLGQDIAWRPLHVFDFGQSGVTFFFILSGFVLTWSAPAARSAPRFYLRRAARIYPSMIVALAAAVVLVAVWPALPITGGGLGLVAAVFAVQSWFPGSYPVYAYNPVAWSLSVEAFFYAVFPWVLGPLTRARASTQVALATTLGAACIIATVLLARDGHGADVAFNNPLVRSSEFCSGIVLALRMRAGWRPRVPLWLASSGVVLAALVSRGVPDFPLFDFVMAVSFIGLIAAAAQRDLDGAQGWMAGRVSVYLGTVSYCFYLVHWLVIAAVVQAAGWHRHWSIVGGVEPLAVALTASSVVAVALHHAVEVPAARRLSTRRATTVAAPRTVG